MLPAGAWVFGGQVWHAVAADVAEYLPVAQSAHASLPDTALNFPAVHASMITPWPVYPALATQAPMFELPPGEVEPGAQPTQ